MKIWLNQLDGTSSQLEANTYQDLIQQLEQDGVRLVAQGINID